MNEEMRDLLGVVPPAILSLAMFVLAWRRIGGWRSIRTPRIVGPVAVGALGIIPMVMGSSGALIIAGALLLVAGTTTAGAWWAIRSVQLQRALQRLDDYVQGSEPLPLPQGKPALLGDVALAARLLADPALSHGMDPLVVERVGDLQAGRTARPLPAPRG